MNTLSLFKNRPILSAVAFAMAVGVPASFYAAPAPVEAAAGDLDRAVDALRGISTMKADFVQTDRNGSSVTGVMTLKRPGKIRFEYEKGADLLVVSNGKSMYMIDYAVSQVQRWPIKNSPLGALLDPSRDVKKYGKLIETSHNDVVSIEVRDKSRPEFGVITLIFARDSSAPGGLRLTHWVALDSQNHRTTVRLRNHRYGMSVADSTFTFRDPRKSSRRPG